MGINCRAGRAADFDFAFLQAMVFIFMSGAAAAGSWRGNYQHVGPAVERLPCRLRYPRWQERRWQYSSCESFEDGRAPRHATYPLCLSLSVPLRSRQTRPACHTQNKAGATRQGSLVFDTCGSGDSEATSHLSA
ncbi:hypothetical protein FA95DRAFT_865941 [Auriscalpium vulgare]|uniref:Uncharacterized protein n=1 Tax=Auriscalpium vulgare TaxID=40419 RepID=A0ACB8R9A8_9AGAM|nr:hypothetical protein FA95DRAFT_865941 [Auriscalpium vulgare]